MISQRTLHKKEEKTHQRQGIHIWAFEPFGTDSPPPFYAIEILKKYKSNLQKKLDWLNPSAVLYKSNQNLGKKIKLLTLEQGQSRTKTGSMAYFNPKCSGKNNKISRKRHSFETIPCSKTQWRSNNEEVYNKELQKRGIWKDGIVWFI